jgi:simple sugar transport system ATP-binding protein
LSDAVRLIGISKAFGAVKALDDVTLAVQAGTIHALVGENGAGKTTLMRILYGATQADAGTIEIDGKPVVLRSSAAANEAGIGMVSQHYGIIPALTCLQNLVLGAEGGVVLDKRSQEARADSLARQMGFSFDWDAEASALSPAATQKLEILKLLWRQARIMILDEPTAMLSPSDADALFDSLRVLVTEGATVILVTHRLPEVMKHCSRVTVLRGGRFVGEKGGRGHGPQ